MKKIHSKILLLVAFVGVTIFASSCTPDLLEQTSTKDLNSENFWQTTDDATYALYGAYGNLRACFNMDYCYDGMAIYWRMRGDGDWIENNLFRGQAYKNSFLPEGSTGNNDRMFQNLYGLIHRTNYVIENVQPMYEEQEDATRKAELGYVIGEATMMRAMAYFKLITLFGDVPYFTKVITVSADMPKMVRENFIAVKDSVLKDLTAALSLLPDKRTNVGRMGKAAALGMLGKVHLYTACWYRSSWPWPTPMTTDAALTVNGQVGGRPETGLAPDDAKSQENYVKAAEYFKTLIDNIGTYGVKLFRNGAAGSPGEMGSMTDQQQMPNYYYQFTPVASDGGESGKESAETIIGFTHGGMGTGQGEGTQRVFGGRSNSASQNVILPYITIERIFQDRTTGDFAPQPLFPASTSDANLEIARTTKGYYICPDTYENRDLRMKSSIMWEGESCCNAGGRTLNNPSLVHYIYAMWDTDILKDVYVGVARVNYKGRRSFRQDTGTTSYASRKWIRDYAGQNRDEGDMTIPYLRLADVYLMYAEASNEAYGPQGDDGTALRVVNEVRGKGGLPALKPAQYADKEAFFYSIENERAVELNAEGHIRFDLMRWRRLEYFFRDPQGRMGQNTDGVEIKDIHGGHVRYHWRNRSIQDVQREYIVKYPNSEIVRALEFGNVIPQTPVWN